MISAKTNKTFNTANTAVHVSGSNPLLFGELIAVVDAVSKAIFKDDEKNRIAMLNDLPSMVLMSSSAESSRIEFPCSLEELKKLGGDKE